MPSTQVLPSEPNENPAEQTHSPVVGSQPEFAPQRDPAQRSLAQVHVVHAGKKNSTRVEPVETRQSALEPEQLLPPSQAQIRNC